MAIYTKVYKTIQDMDIHQGVSGFSLERVGKYNRLIKSATLSVLLISFAIFSILSINVLIDNIQSQAAQAGEFIPVVDLYN